MALVQQATPQPDPSLYGDWRAWAEDLIRTTSVESLILRAVINGRLTFGDGTDTGNFEAVWLKDQVTNATPDTDTSYSHNIGRTPIGLFVLKRDKAGVIYAGSGAWTSTALTLRSNVASVTFTALVIAAPGDM